MHKAQTYRSTIGLSVSTQYKGRAYIFLLFFIYRLLFANEKPNDMKTLMVIIRLFYG